MSVSKSQEGAHNAALSRVPSCAVEHVSRIHVVDSSGGSSLKGMCEEKERIPSLSHLVCGVLFDHARGGLVLAIFPNSLVMQPLESTEGGKPSALSIICLASANDEWAPSQPRRTLFFNISSSATIPLSNGTFNQRKQTTGSHLTDCFPEAVIGERRGVVASHLDCERLEGFLVRPHAVLAPGGKVHGGKGTWRVGLGGRLGNVIIFLAALTSHFLSTE